MEKQPWKCSNCGHDMFYEATVGRVDRTEKGGTVWHSSGKTIICLKCHTPQGFVPEDA